MSWCCDFASNSFAARLTYGHFMVAGVYRETGDVWFLGGFNMCHRKDYSDVTAACSAASEAIAAEGITNFKLLEYGVIHYCQQCGANLRKHYGENGGLLRDDEYVGALTAK